MNGYLPYVKCPRCSEYGTGDRPEHFEGDIRIICSKSPAVYRLTNNGEVIPISIPKISMNDLEKGKS